MTLELTLSCKEYMWTKPLSTGEVEIEGVDLTVAGTDYSSPERFTRMLKHGEFDICELSMGSFLASQEHSGEFQVSAIPVFPHRRFRQSFLFTHEDSSIESPADLNNGDIGVVNWQTTTGLWVRGVLGEYHDLDLESVKWHLPGSEIISVTVPGKFDHEYVPDDKFENISRSSEQMIEMTKSGEIDAFIYTSGIDDPEIERVFSDTDQTEKEFYKQTEIFPIMHNVVIKDKIVDENPWVVNRIYKGFERALDKTMEQVHGHGWFKLSPLVWSLQHLEDQRDVMGTNPWEYGLTDRNRKNLRKLIKYANHQGLISEEYDVDDLFLPHSETGMFG